MELAFLMDLKNNGCPPKATRMSVVYCKVRQKIKEKLGDIDKHPYLTLISNFVANI